MHLAHSDSLLAGFAAWRATQGIYRLHPEVLESVWRTPLNGNLPVELFFHLPEWCVYAETNGCFSEEFGAVRGVFAFLDFDVLTRETALVLIVDGEVWIGNRNMRTGEDFLYSLPVYRVPLIPNLSLLECVYARLKDSVRKDLATATNAKDMTDAITPLISLVLYLCSVTAEYRPADGGQGQPGNPKPTRTKKDVKKGRPARLITPARPRVWEVSYRLGAALAAAREQAAREPGTGTHASPRPHVRRAHWHTFLAGPRNQPRERRLKWMPPIAVALNDADELVPVVRPVGEKRKAPDPKNTNAGASQRE
jgi:hypothetical protein